MVHNGVKIQFFLLQNVDSISPNDLVSLRRFKHCERKLAGKTLKTMQKKIYAEDIKSSRYEKKYNRIRIVRALSVDE